MLRRGREFLLVDWPDYLPQGVAYTKDLSDEALAAEVLSRVVTFTRTWGDGAQGGDGLTVAVSKVLGDGALAGDGLTAAMSKALVDEALAAEVLSRVVTFVRTWGDGAQAGDGLTAAVSKALGDGALAGDGLTAAMSKVLADEALAAEVLSAVMAFVRTWDDGAQAGEMSLVRAVGKALADGTVISETLSPVATGKALADAMTISDTLSLFGIGKALAETVLASEALSRVVTFARTLTEYPAASEAIAKALTLAPWTDDGVNADDVLSWIYMLEPITEIVTAEDGAPSTAVEKALTDGVLAGEALAKALTLAAWADGVTVADLLIQGWALAVSDGVVAGDTFSRLVEFARTISEAPVAGEALTKALALGAWADEVTIAEALVQGWAIAFADAILAADTAARAPGKAVADGVAADDALTKAITARLQAAILAGEERQPFSIGKVLADQVNAGEALGRVIGFVRSFSDAAAAGDALTKAVALAAWGDAVAAGDAVTRTAEKAVSDQVAAGEALTKVIATLIESGVAAREHIEGLPDLLLTLAETVLASDAATVVSGKALADQVDVEVGLPAVVALPGVWLTLWGDAEGRATGQILRLVVGDTLPFLIFKLTDAESGVYDLDDATVTLRMSDREGTITVEAACTMVDAQDGLVRYELTTDDTATAGEYRAHLVIAVGGREFVSESFVVRIRERL